MNKKTVTIHTCASFNWLLSYRGVNYNNLCTQNAEREKAKAFSILAQDSHYFGISVKSNKKHTMTL